MVTKKILTISTFVILFGSLTATAMPAFAQSGGGGNNFFSGFVQFLANTFHLDQGQVQSAVNNYKIQQKAKMQQTIDDREKKRLDMLVSQGKITASQEQAIIQERDALRAKYNTSDFKNLTPQQRKQKLTDEQNEINSWAQSQGIDPKYVIPGFGKFPKMGMRRFDRWSIPSATPTP